jgi:protein phosphatase 1G
MGMQGYKIKIGWRTKMEDSHIAQTGLPDKVSVFGVFDGHGGAEVALFVKKHFIATL